MDVEQRIIERVCEGCDIDPTKCLHQGYCEYDGPDEDDTVEFALKEAYER